MNSSQLQGRHPELPLTLGLHTGDELVVQQWLRVLPGQRYVGRALWRGRSVLAKLFVGGKAQRHFQRELNGVQLLLQQGLTTPELLASDYDAAFGGWVLFEYLDGAQSLDQQWQQVAGQPVWTPAQQQVLEQALACIAQMHRKGLWQGDIHLDNFMLHNGQLYIIDGGGIASETPGQPLTTETALQNLAVFFAQLSPELDDWLEPLLKIYIEQGGQQNIQLASLRDAIAKIRRWRIRDYLKKTARDCSLFSVNKSVSGVTAMQRGRMDEVAELVAAPDRFIDSGHIYKTGGAATVARVEHKGQSWIIKRYNIKDFLHWLKRCWRPSRAWHSWQAGFLLELEGIAVVQNVAVRERRLFGLRRQAWLISEYAGEQDLIDRFAPYIDSGEVPEQDLLSLQQLLAGMIRAKISHGDLKGHNILWHNDRCLLIDLDAVRQHKNHGSFVRAFKRDRARLLRNWPQDSPLYLLLDKHLPQID